MARLRAVAPANQTIERLSAYLPATDSDTILSGLDGQIKAVWTGIPVRGSHAFAVTEDRVLFGGGYNEKDRLYLTHLYPGAQKSETVIPVDSGGKNIAATGPVVGRGSRLYLLRETELFVLDLNLHL